MLGMPRLAVVAVQHGQLVVAGNLLHHIHGLRGLVVVLRGLVVVVVIGSAGWLGRS